MVSRPSDAGSGVAASRFEKDLVVGKVGQLLADKVGLQSICNDENVFGGNYRQNTVESHLQERASCAEEVNKLFGAIGAAIGPKTAADAATHYYAISMIVCGL